MSAINKNRGYIGRFGRKVLTVEASESSTVLGVEGSDWDCLPVNRYAGQSAGTYALKLVSLLI